MYLKGIYTNTQ
jgi:hypothetical protein